MDNHIFVDLTCGTYKVEFRFFKTLTDDKIRNGVRKLVDECDRDFIPPLSCRSSTSEQNLDNTKESATGRNKDIAEEPNPGTDKYFESLCEQMTLVALINRSVVVGFMSFRKNYNEGDSGLIHTDKYPHNIYISTIIINPCLRRKGITRQFYKIMLHRYSRYDIFTRTWSTNESHISLLESLDFHEFGRKYDDRGKGIDTVYFHLEPSRVTLSRVIRNYHLRGNIIFFLSLVVFSILTVYLWYSSRGFIMGEFFLAMATSLTASALCLISDTASKIKEALNDNYINTLKGFGIENLQFHKEVILKRIIPKCQHEIWISGYRLIMTARESFRIALKMACEHKPGLNIRILIVPQWSDTYKKVYSEENCADNYIIILDELCPCISKYNLNLEVRFTEQPIFNDTYKVDNRFITGPYLHCSIPGDEDRQKPGKIEATDFFSLDINNPSKHLYKLIRDDYLSVWDNAKVLDIGEYQSIAMDCRTPEEEREMKKKYLEQCCSFDSACI